MIRDPSWLDLLFFAAVVAFVVIQAARTHFSSTQTPVERLQDRYAAGEIDATEFERQLEFVVDDRNEQIRTVVEGVNGVGDATSTAIAREYESIDELRESDRERLESVPGVGPDRADAVLERVR